MFDAIYFWALIIGAFGGVWLIETIDKKVRALYAQFRGRTPRG